MFNSFILEIPDLRSVLHPKDVLGWEVVYARAELVFGKISWQISSDGDCYSIQDPRIFPDYLEQVQVDFKMNRIVFINEKCPMKSFSIWWRILWRRYRFISNRTKCILWLCLRVTVINECAHENNVTVL
ncbi:hypothetical protein [Planococcus halocryophilus]|uniref:hypothetical protein n=1 Tax=Planococcus halocryophilus TaxID=1215089 RepID=UPI000594BA11|nr:hypothetical protein [Planococcus halocryophilus]